MTGKARLTSLASKMQAAKADTPARTAGEPVKHGEKGDFVKLTVTLPPHVYELVMQEVTRRKMAKEREPVISAVLREAVEKHLGGK